MQCFKINNSGVDFVKQLHFHRLRNYFTDHGFDIRSFRKSKSGFYKSIYSFFSYDRLSSFRTPVSQLVYKSSFHPDTYSCKSLKLNMCPNTREIRKYIPSLRKVVPIAVPCGRCLFCKHHKQNQLIYRVWNHNKAYNHSWFITLTYNDEHLTDDPVIAKDDITKFLKRLRFHLSLAGVTTSSYLLCCERGFERNRIHFHLLFWYNEDIKDSFFKGLVRLSWKAPRRNILYLSNAIGWNKPSSPIGFLYFGQVNNKTITYCTKYSLKDSGTLFIRWSHGLGLNLIEESSDMVDFLRFYPVVSYQVAGDSKPSRSCPVPKYYKDKVLSDTERQAIFKDYLLSEVYKEKLYACNSPDVIMHYANLYDNYLASSLAAAKTHHIKRNQRNTNLH